jgi:hypothetical protein
MNPETVDHLLIALKIFGAVSFLGIIGFLVACYALPPNLSIEEVKDKTKHKATRFQYHY